MGEFIPSEALFRRHQPSWGTRLAETLGLGRQDAAAGQLTRLNDHMLRDIGLSRDEIDHLTHNMDRNG